MSTAAIPLPSSTSSLGHVFKVSLYLLTALASFTLGMGDEQAFPVMLTPPLCLAAFLLNERRRVISISANWSNVLAAIALVVTAIEFWPEDLLRRLLAGAHLLVYLTWVVLFQEKRVAQYWLLLAMGLLQVAVAAVLTVSGWFGVLLLAYMVLAIWTVSVYSLYQGEMRFAGEARRGTLLAEGTTGRSMVRNSVQLDPAERWLSPRFVGGILLVAFGGLALGLAFFLFVPRMWVGGLNVLASDATGPLAGRALTGFREEVTLADIGTLLDNTDVVLSIKAADDRGEPADLGAWADRMDMPDLLFRGAVFDTYGRDASNRGRWSAETRDRVLPLKSLPGRTRIRMEVEREAIGTDLVFPLWPLLGAAWSPDRQRNASLRRTPSDVIYPERRGGADSDDRNIAALRYVVFLPATRDQNGLSMPGPNLTPPGDIAVERYKQLSADLDRLRDLAATTIRPENLPRGPGPLRRRQALALEGHLRNSGIYQYTRDTSISDPGIDPVEDFLFNRKAGHCQYYAAALTLMLRAVKIPARMVNGFKGADPGAKPGEYIVQQRHAHSWVEAWIAPAAGDPLGSGEWLVLDPTPAARDASVAAMTGENSSTWAIAQQSLSSLWNTYVAGLNMDRQQQAFFEPLQQLFQGIGKAFSGEQGFSFPRWAYLLATNPQMWFTWEGALTAIGLLGFVWGSYFGVRYMARKLGRWTSRRRQGGRAVRVDFYERFARLLASRGLHRREEQTAREFSTLAGRVLHPELSSARLASVFPELVDAFYRVRYGNTPLTPDEAAAVNGQLDRLQECLKQSTDSRQRSAVSEAH